MLCYQQDFFKPTEELTAEQFAQLIVSDQVVGSIKCVRQLLGQAREKEVLIGANPAPDEPMNQQLEQERKELLTQAAKAKRALPKIVWQATFADTPSKSGIMGTWRKQSACRLNGLFMIDIDHLEEPQLTLKDMTEHTGHASTEEMCRDLRILLVHVTPSGKGLRLVAVADAQQGNISDNQHRLAEKLGVQIDESCKDATRLSFCPGFEDIIYINSKELFNYDNPEFDEKYGPQYRGGCSKPTAGGADYGASTAGPRIGAVGQPAPAAAEKAAEADGAGVEPDAGHGEVEKRVKEGYHGKSYNEIIDVWCRQVLHGVPKTGDRHQSLFRMACDLRYICDHDPQLLARVLEECAVGAAIVGERGRDEIVRIAADACARQRWPVLPRRVRAVLAAAGVLCDGEGAGAGAEEPSAIDYDAFACRLDGLLSDSPGLREAVEDLPPQLKLGGVLAAGAMLGTYLTRCWWEHFDGKYYRLSFLVYVVGAAASGKSFITQLDKLLMAPMLVADRIGREAEKHYKDKQRARKANEQLPEMPHPVIRYCPSTTSNAILYRRLQDAVDPNVTDPETDEPLHMHLITVESELATALRAQVGSWAGKSDLELKSFHNEKAGVDFANAESTNGIMQINWNQVISGTKESLSRKIKPQNVLDGLVTRLAVFPMPENDFQMLERKHAVRNHERDCRLRQLGYDLEQVAGELRVPRLVDFCYQYEEELTRLARLEQDKCLDYFRKRIPVIMIRYTLVRMVLRQLEDARKGKELKVEDSDLEFARLIGDWCLQAQMFMFGQMVMDAQEKEEMAFVPRKYHTKTRSIYNALPDKITVSDIIKAGLAEKVKYAMVVLRRWEKDDLVETEDDATWTKKIQKI